MRVGGWSVLLGALLIAAPGTSKAQGWLLDAAAGSAEYEAVAGDVGTANAIVGVHRQGRRWLSLQGGVPLDSAAIPWLAAAGGGRWATSLRSVELGLDAALFGFGYHVDEIEASGGGVTVLGLPYLAYGRGPVRVEGQSGLMQHTSFFEGDRRSRAVHHSSVRGVVVPRAGLRLSAEARLVAAAEGNYPFTGLRLELGRGALSGWFRAGRWFAEELDGADWGLGGRVSFPGHFFLRVAFERHTNDPLYWNGARRGWTIGLSRTIGPRGVHGRGRPVPGTMRIASGPVEMALVNGEIEGGTPPSIAGDFTGWQPVPMELRGDTWTATFHLSPGVYHYAFQGADGRWFLPPSVQSRADDGFGGTNGVLIVSDS